MTIHLPPMVLVVEADPVLRTTTSNSLERGGFMVSSKSSTEDAIEFIKTAPSYQKPQFVLVGNADYNIAKESAKKIEKLWTTEQKPVMIFVCNNEFSELDIENIKNDFHDAISRPFSQLELITRIKELLSEHHVILREKILAFGNIKMDLMSYRVMKNNREVHLGPTEFKILHHFLDNPHKIFSREEIMQYVWGKDSNMEVRTVDVHINRLRTALSEPGKSDLSIKTVRSAGYCLELPQAVK